MKLMGRQVARPLVKLSIFAVITLLATAMLGQALASYSFDGTLYRAQFSDVTSLLKGDDVRIAGVKVGQVKEIKLARANGTDVAEVAFTVDDSIPLTDTVRAKVRFRNLVGQRYIALSEGPGGGATLRPRGLIPIARTEPALDLTALFNGFRPLFSALTPEDVNRFTYEIVRVLQGEAGTVASLLSHTASLTNTLADRDEVIGRVITNLNQVLGTLNARDQQLSQTIAHLQAFISGLAADRTALGESLQSISALATATGGLIRDARPALKEDIVLLSQLAATLNANSAVLEGTLARLPVRFAALTRTGSHGSWFNFLLCEMSAAVSATDGGGSVAVVPTINVPQPGC